ncbi:uncharacterized protein H6S33_006843 [Morchella sextelata]|uniref:uncharacterized protein n=1 Tax=Morchella sextelata TaxID=1174677 RepID=UPI001D04E831|nr:uncharacterized protein H6S33_006843 [Morchella sextelata]KAH0604466.1 hypothetical protein H6S33_006843 [Morchella sextelata]
MLVRLRRQVKMLEVPVPRERMWGPRWEEVVRGAGGGGRWRMRRCRGVAVPAYALDNRELEWLEAFLETCDYMSGMQEMWSEGVTVQEWWRSREVGV